MPYPRWLETARRHAARPAIFTDRTIVTFADLTAGLARQPRAGGPVIARAGSVDFFIQILRAWRDGQAAIPIEAGAAEPELVRQPPPGICLVKHTPGASGIPRGIFLTGAQIVADGDRIAEAMELTPGSVNLAAISLAHSYGFSNIVLPLLLHGVPAHLAPVPFPRVIEEIFQKHPRLVVPAVPSMWRAWLRAGILKSAPIRLAVSAGAPLTMKLETNVWYEAGLKIHNFYGASECGGISYDSSNELRSSQEDVGTPLPGVNILRSADDRIGVASSSVAAAYDSPRDGDLLENGFYLTRDLGFLDPGGRLHLAGTLGGAINVAGRKVSPVKVETAIRATGLVRDIRVHGIASADPERCQEIVAEVELAEGVSLENLKRALAGNLQSWETPRHWRAG